MVKKINFFVLSLMLWVGSPALFAQSLQEYISTIQSGAEGTLIIPLSGEPYPNEEEVYLTGYEGYQDEQSIDYLKDNIALKRKVINVGDQQVLSVRMYLSALGEEESLYYGQSLCWTQGDFLEKNDPVLNDYGSIPSRVYGERYVYPQYIEANEDNLMSSYKPVSAQYTLNLVHVPVLFCDDIVKYWNKCDRIEIAYTMNKKFIPTIEQHGIDKHEGDVETHHLELTYHAHNVICGS